MPYYVTGILTFSNNSNRNNARTAMESVPLGSATPWAGGPYPGGIATGSGPTLTVSFVVPDDDARTYVRALLDACAGYIRNAGHLSVVKAPE